MTLIVAILIGFQLSGADRPAAVEGTHAGKARLLSETLKQAGVAADPGPIALQVVLVDEAGSIRPLLSNDASRALFLDERLRDRPVEVLAREWSGLPYLEVVTLKVLEQGMLRTPEYHCEICSIDVRFPQDCPCCQGPLELRYRPAPEDR